jgi:hypothetical protein
VDLADFVPSLRREVTPPGSDVFSDVSDDVFTGYLADAFWEARLDGFLPAWEADEDGVVTPVPPNTVDLPRDQIAAILIYAGVRVLRNQILNTQTSFQATAGPVSYQVQNSATMLVEMLKQLKAVKDRLVDNIAIDQPGTVIGYIDAYAARLGLSEQYVLPGA